MPTLSHAPSPTAPPEPGNSQVSFPIVGIGASAGGIEAMLRFLENAPSDMGMAFVVVLLLSPRHVSHADIIFQQATGMAVVQVREPVQLAQNHVYVVAPGTALAMVDGCLHVEARDLTESRPTTIDRFFRALADAHGERAVAIVLSGSGSDGAVGISRIKERGGITLVQQPNDAEFSEMPENAIGTPHVDLVLPVVDMPQKLLELASNARAISMPNAEAGESGDLTSYSDASPAAADSDDAEESLQDVLSYLRLRTGHDFKHYKRATVLRRIERRLQVNALRDLPSYASFLRQIPAETSALLADMLIGVTNFFRDREAFEALERDIVPSLFTRQVETEPVRVWAAGCSTGEEAYSLTMLLTQHAELVRSNALIQVFATDIDDVAIERARKGRYPASIVTDLPPIILRQYFSTVNGDFQVEKVIREKMLFAVHSILRDPPFSKLNLVSCRNLLIYLDRTVQRQVLELFHFALRSNGFLFLGSAESAELADDLFTVVDKKNRIYQARAGVTRKRSSLGFALPLRDASGAISAREKEVASVTAVHSDRRDFDVAGLHYRMLEQHTPPSVVIDRDSKIVHLSDNAGRFLHHAGGELSNNIVAVVLPELRIDLRTTIFRALTIGASVEARPVLLKREGNASWINMSVRPFHDSATNTNFLLVVFDEIQDRMAGNEQSPVQIDPVKIQLENELQRGREQLTGTIEQYETAVEELKASNEELQAMNEELRSATEELESSKEALRSVNEELTTLNVELQARIAETAKADDDLQNIIASSDIATVFVDKQLRILRYTPNVTKLFNLIASDVGRALFDITHTLHYPMLAKDVQQTFATLKMVEREVSSEDGRWFLTRLLPYRTADDRIDGAVLTLVDVTDRHYAEQAVKAGEERLRLAAQSTNHYAIIVQDPNGNIVSWNAGAKKVFGYSEEEVVGKNLELIFTSDDRANGVPKEERKCALESGFAEEDRWHVTKQGSRVYCSGVMTPINEASFVGFAKIARDVTSRKLADDEERLRLRRTSEYEKRPPSSRELKDDFIAVLAHELKNPLNLINMKAELLPRMPEVRGVACVENTTNEIRHAVRAQAQIIDDLLDLSRVRTGKLLLRKSRFDLSSLLRQVADMGAMIGQERNIEVVLTEVESPASAQLDAVRCEQILWNLVGNALKFSARNSQVCVSLKADQEAWRIDVLDRGQGIEPALLPHIFEMYSQSIAGRAQGGLGIGLALVKQLAELQGGRVEAASDGPGLGACVSVWLPRENDHAISFEEPAEAAGELSGFRVVIIDDHEEATRLLANLLELDGARVKIVPSADHAVTAICEEPCKAVIVPMRGAQDGGLDLVRQLRSDGRNADMVCIAVSPYNRPSEQQAAIAAGCELFFSTPVVFDSLKAAIINRFNRR